MNQSLRNILNLPDIGREISKDIPVADFRQCLDGFEGLPVAVSYNHGASTMQEDFLYATFRLGEIVMDTNEFGHIRFSTYAFWTIDPKDIIDVVPISILEQPVSGNAPLKSFHLEARNEGEEFDVIHTDPYRASLAVSKLASHMPKWFDVREITPVVPGMVYYK